MLGETAAAAAWEEEYISYPMNHPSCSANSRLKRPQVPEPVPKNKLANLPYEKMSIAYQETHPFCSEVLESLLSSGAGNRTRFADGLGVRHNWVHNCCES